MTTVYDFPTLNRAPVSFEFWLASNTQTFTSPLDNSMQTLEIPGARWMCSLPYSSLLEIDAARAQAFMFKMRGQANRVRLWNMARPVPRGSLGPAAGVTANGAQASGASLNVKGCPVASELLEGDLIGVNGELRMVVADATADGSGHMSLALDSPLRADVADGAGITLNKPTAIFVFSTPESPHSLAQKAAAGIVTTITMQFQEIW